MKYKQDTTVPSSLTLLPALLLDPYCLLRLIRTWTGPFGLAVPRPLKIFPETTHFSLMLLTPKLSENQQQISTHLPQHIFYLCKNFLPKHQITRLSSDFLGIMFVSN